MKIRCCGSTDLCNHKVDRHLKRTVHIQYIKIRLESQYGIGHLVTLLSSLALDSICFGAWLYLNYLIRLIVAVVVAVGIVVIVVLSKRIFAVVVVVVVVVAIVIVINSNSNNGQFPSVIQ